MVSKFGHCLNDLLFRWSTGRCRSTSRPSSPTTATASALATSYGMPFHHVPVTPDTKADAEAELLALVDSLGDRPGRARPLHAGASDDTCRALDGRAINIHHSFLPSFKGASPTTRPSTAA